MFEETSVFGPEEHAECDAVTVDTSNKSILMEDIKVTSEHVKDSAPAAVVRNLPESSFTSASSVPIITQSEKGDSCEGNGLGHHVSDEEREEREFIDEFGFVIDEEQKNRELLYVNNIDGKRTIRREIKWANMASDWDNVNSKRHDILKKRCRKGIPARFRGVAWQLLLGSHKQMCDPANRGIYKSLHNKELADKELAQVIGRDLARTFPKHVLFRDEGGIGQTFLRNVLHAYACIDPEVGYVQGMGFVVGALSTQMGEEETFWALHVLMYCDRYRLREMYRPGFPMLHQLFYQLKRLLARLIPKLHKHFESIGVDPSFYASQWFMTLFVYHFQFRAMLRVWDIFMSEGWKIIFRVAIALMKWEQKRLVTMPFEDVLPALKNLHEGKDPDEILRRARNVKIKTAELQSYSDEYWRMQNAAQ